MGAHFTTTNSSIKMIKKDITDATGEKYENTYGNISYLLFPLFPSVLSYFYLFPSDRMLPFFVQHEIITIVIFHLFFNRTSER